MELLRAYAEIFSDCSYWLALEVPAAYEQNLEEAGIDVILRRFSALKDECDRLNLEMTSDLLVDAIAEAERAKSPGGSPLLHDTIHHICDILRRELSHQLFIKISSGRRLFYDEPFNKWQTIVKRFPNTTRDVEEMNKCFALSRYTAAMFHAMQIAEVGAIELGDYIGATDPKKGWDATRRSLDELIKQGHLNLPPTLSGKFEFLEQMHREIDSMTLAWRNKIDHVANRLAILPNTDFTPDIAEHIIGAVRVFMLRLSEAMPRPAVSQ